MNGGDQLIIAVANGNVKLRQRLLTRRGLLVQLIEQSLVEAEARPDRTLRIADVINGRGFVPNPVIPAEIVHQHQHVERVGHGV